METEVQTMIKKYTLEEIEFIKQNYANMGPTKCSIILKRKPQNIGQKARKLGLKTNKETKSKICSIRRTKLIDDYEVKTENFVNIKDPIYAYILGLLWGDGYIQYNQKHNGVLFTTTYPDANYFTKIFLSTGPWNIYDRIHKNKNWKKSCTLHTSNKFLAKYLFDYDYKSKSNMSADKILQQIPKQFHKYWFLGLLDADGCIYFEKGKKHNVSISSSINQDWNFIEQFLKELGVKYNISKRSPNKKGHSSSAIYINNRIDCLKLLNYLYNDIQNNQIGLPRKYNKYLLMKNSQEIFDNRGVCKTQNGKKWRAYVHVHVKPTHKQIFLGTFDTKELALERVKRFKIENPKLFSKPA